MKSKKNLLISAAMAGLALAATGCASNSSAGSAKEVMCHGVNSCKAKGQCAGKVDTCSGKSGCEAKMSCAGANSCKGKGLIKMGKDACKKKGGKAAS
jgi:hypothetical protein